jgi:hypothetical protein
MSSNCTSRDEWYSVLIVWWCRLDPPKNRGEARTFPADFCTWNFLGRLSRYAAFPFTFALFPGHSDITRFHTWPPIATENHLDRAKRKNSKTCSDDWQQECVRGKVLRQICGIYIYLTAIGWTPGDSSTSHIYTQTIHIIQRKENLGSAGPAPSLRVIPWHLPYNWGKSTGKPQFG